MQRRVFSFIFSIMFVAACAGAPAPETRTEADVYQAMCESLIRCGDYGGARFTDVEGCVAYFSASPELCSSEPMPLNGDVAEQNECLDALRAMQCDAMLFETKFFPEACDGVFLGLEGESCDPWPCAAGLYCSDPSPEQGCRICLKAGGVGAPCTRSSPCDYGLTCSVINTDPGTCVAQHAAEGETCERSTDCEETRFCDDGTCAAQRPIGGSCEGHGQCLGGLSCRDGQCSGPLAWGAACADDSECGLGLCVLGECTRPSYCGKGDLGSPCLGDRGCGEGLYCDGPWFGTGRCTQQAMLGEGCSSDDACPQGTHCHQSTSTCQEPTPAGGECRADTECDTGLRCENFSQCAQALSEGEACNDSSDCLSGFCYEAACAALPVCGG